jgi:hypothetical protein
MKRWWTTWVDGSDAQPLVPDDIWHCVMDLCRCCVSSVFAMACLSRDFHRLVGLYVRRHLRALQGTDSRVLFYFRDDPAMNTLVLHRL